MKKKSKKGRRLRGYSLWTKRLMIMKATVIFMCVFGLMSSFAKTNAQNSKLDFQIEKGTVKEVLEKIEQQTGLSFMYDNDVFDVNREISLTVNNESIENVMKSLLAEKNLKYEKINRFIVISADQLNSAQQSKTVSGRVTDSSGTPLPGVTVLVKGTTQGIVTDVDGKYSIANVPGDATLVFSFVGMKMQEIAIAGKTSINVVMEEDAIGIEEVVAIGYGTSQKRDLTGAISSVNAKDISSNSITTPDQALQGRIAGVQVQTSSHAPGGGISVQVRGTSSLSADGQPLYVVDGFPISNEFSSASSVDGTVAISQNPLNSIDPSNIESIEVLKDASSTAIYGARGANGVVLITTKKGKTGKSTVTFESSTSVDTPSKYLDFLTAEEWGTLVNEADDANGTARTFTDAEIAGMGKGTDWQRAVLRTALTQNYKNVGFRRYVGYPLPSFRKLSGSGGYCYKF